MLKRLLTCRRRAQEDAEDSDEKTLPKLMNKFKKRERKLHQKQLDLDKELGEKEDPISMLAEVQNSQEI